MSVDEAEVGMPEPEVKPQVKLPPGVELYSGQQIKESAYARVLLLGPKQIGKTTALMTTAPKPLSLNCDGWNALKGAARLNPELQAIDVSSEATWRKGCMAARALVEAGLVETVVVDTVTLLADRLVDELKLRGMKGWDLYGEVSDIVIECVEQLNALPAHLFFVAHMQSDHDKTAGVLPDIGGQLKRKLPRYVDDWVLFNVDTTASPKRRFILGCYENWIASGRNIKREAIIPAEVPALFAELGIAL